VPLTRVALVTGAARGIGAATVEGLAAAGWRVVALDRCSDDARLPYALGSSAELEAVVARAGEAAGDAARVTPFVGDATDPAALAGAVAVAERDYGGLDAVVAAAGVIAGGVPLWEMPPQQEQAVIEGNLRTVLAAARVGIPALLRRAEPRDGRFIAIASAAATRGVPKLAAYCAAKAGVVGLVRALAAELRGTGVTANAINPGSTRTAILEESARLYNLPSAESFAVQQPLERLLEPSEVAAMVVWLAGPAGSGVTGAALAMDGGLAL
jgi:SDR family mycofactocin-dependent oxidoreductase